MTDQPMPAARLAEIEGRATDPCVSAYRTYKIMREQDIPALVAEVRRLREALAGMVAADIYVDDAVEKIEALAQARAALGETSNG